jgi:uncharacterized peroxidase-related enzyme
MPRISLVGRSEAAGSVREVFDRKIAERGNIPNMYGAFAHRPWLLSTLDAHVAAVMGSGTVPMKLKEMLAVQTSRINGCEYGTRTHGVLAERTGATAEQLASLLDAGTGPFSEREKAALRFGEHMTRSAGSMPDDAFRELRKHFDEGEIVEIASVVGLFAYLNRFTEALGIEPTPPGEGPEER